MKAIISHDIDHFTPFEHLLKDAILPKHMARMHIELFSGKISINEYGLRWSELFKNKWQNIDELIQFNNTNNIPSSFFIAVSQGLGLSYSNNAAISWITHMQKYNCEINIHGIEFNNQDLINKEFELFKSFTGKKNIGMRMHYVRNSGQTFNFLSEAGYYFDSSDHGFKNPYKIGSMWEFPFQIMDGWVIENGKKWQSVNLEKAKEKTLKLIDEAHEKNINYLGIDFHDRYFSNAFYTWINWYTWLVEYLKANKVEFVNFDTAIKELES